MAKDSGILPVGTRIAATADVGPIIRGQIGIITGLGVPHRFFRWRRKYSCTFLGDIRVTMPRNGITPNDHDFPNAMIDNPVWFLHTRDLPGLVPLHHGDALRPRHEIDRRA